MVLAVAMAACSGGTSTNHTSRPRTPNLNGTWIPTEIAGAPVAFELAARPDAPILILDGHEGTGSDGCNGVGGYFETSRTGKLTVRSDGSFAIACDNVPITEAFRQGSSATVAGNSLLLRNGHRVVGRFRRLDPPACHVGGYRATEVRVQLQLVGGPTGAARPLPGTVTATDQNGRACVVLLGARGTARLSPPPGTYTLTGRSPLYEGGDADCRAARTARFSRPPTGGPAPSSPLIFINVDCQAK